MRLGPLVQWSLLGTAGPSRFCWLQLTMMTSSACCCRGRRASALFCSSRARLCERERASLTGSSGRPLAEECVDPRNPVGSHPVERLPNNRLRVAAGVTTVGRNARARRGPAAGEPERKAPPRMVHRARTRGERGVAVGCSGARGEGRVQSGRGRFPGFRGRVRAFRCIVRATNDGWPAGDGGEAGGSARRRNVRREEPSASRPPFTRKGGRAQHREHGPCDHAARRRRPARP